MRIIGVRPFIKVNVAIAVFSGFSSCTCKCTNAEVDIFEYVNGKPFSDFYAIVANKDQEIY